MTGVHHAGRDTGVYFSANDAVLTWTVCFLNSFRRYNPDTRLLLIPFDDRCDKTLALADQYGFETHRDPSFGALEAIGRLLELGHTPYGPSWFRRYAAFWGPLERFVYLDARQVVLMSLDALIHATRRFDLDFVYYDTALDQVYAPGPLRASFLSEGFARGFLSGCWSSRRGLFSLADFQELTQQMLAVREQLNPRNTDQAFINFCCDSRRMRMGKISDFLGDLASSGWARQPGRAYEDGDGAWRLWDHGGNDHNKRLMLLHWAGQGLQSMSQPHVFRHFGGRTRWLSVARILGCLRRSYVIRRVILGHAVLGRVHPFIASRLRPLASSVKVDNAQ
jgi:hypothetical protein